MRLYVHCKHKNGTCWYWLATKTRILYWRICTTLEEKQEAHKRMDRLIQQFKDVKV